MGKRGRPKRSGKRRKYTKRTIEDIPLTAENIIKEIHELKDDYKSILRYIRLELIKSRQEIQDLKDTNEYIESLSK